MIDVGWFVYLGSDGKPVRKACAALSGCILFAAEEADARSVPVVDADHALVWLSGNGAASATLPFDQSGRITRAVEFPIAGLTLRIGAGASVQERDGDGNYAIEGDGIRLGESPVTSAVEIRAGAISFETTVALSDIAPSLRYFYSNEKQLHGFEYPIFAAPGQNKVAVRCRLNPLRPGDPEQNQISPTADAGAPTGFLTVSGEPVSLSFIPERSYITSQWDPVRKELYPVPGGDWKLGPTGSIDVMCGLSGLEFARVEDNSILRFVPGAPSYATSFPHAGAMNSTQALSADCPGSTLPVTTSWIYFAEDVPAAGPQGYYSQPDHGGLFQAGGGDPFLQNVQLRTAGFPPNAKPVFGAPAASFPMTPLAGVAAPDGLYGRFEVEVLSTVRNNAIFEMNFTPGAAAAATPGATAVAVTPQGMLSTFANDFSDWRQLILATLGRGAVSIELRELCPRLRAALLTNQLFLVVSDMTEFQKCCQVIFPGLTIADWTFAFDPKIAGQWRKDSVLILKFAERPMEELIEDISLWSAPGSGFNSGVETQATLRRSVADARSHADLPEFRYFLNTVLKDWNGILFLNCSVPPGRFPEQLRALAAGIDESKFKAHHLGVNLSPVQLNSGQIRVRDSSLFGLIFYDQPGDLVFSGSAYDFKVLSLRVLFANSDITHFSSQIELLVGRLFGELSSLVDSQHGDNLVLNGVMQKQGGAESYSFNKVGKDVFAVKSHVLDNVIIQKAQFVTLPQATGSKLISSRFLLWGLMQYKELPELDLFSFGGPSGLQFSSLFVSMSYGMTGPTGPTAPPQTVERSFAFEAGQMVFDLSASAARPLSLYRRFPLQATGMVQGSAERTPAALGYLPVGSPLDAGSLGEEWFGLRMALGLGSQGSLAAKAGFEATLLAAWAPDEQAYNALVAIQLPGSQNGSKSLTIQGPLKLGIGDIALLYNKDQQAYLLRFANIALSFLSLKFPPGGRTNVLLFGDPEPKGSDTTLGWYAAYLKDEKEKPKGAVRIG
jgi:hypothetical protein